MVGDAATRRVTEKKADLFGIGNALVDILAQVDDDFLGEQQLNKGGMTLVDAETQSALLALLSSQQLRLCSGGSAANTMIALAQSGGSGMYVGRVAHDKYGEFYRQDMLDAGIGFDATPSDVSFGPTGTSLILTTPDAERTMCTNLGVSTSLTLSDIDVDRLATCKYAYIEGYLWDAEAPRKACVETMEQSRKLGVKISFTISDSFLVERFAEDFRAIVRDYCDVVFCNIDEAKQLFNASSIEDCADQLKSMVDLAFVTDGPNGCHVITPNGTQQVPAYEVQAIDTVGAGDAFAGGVLFGLTNGLTDLQAARWGNYFASRIVAVYGARLETSPVGKLNEIIS